MTNFKNTQFLDLLTVIKFSGLTRNRISNPKFSDSEIVTSFTFSKFLKVGFSWHSNATIIVKTDYTFESAFLRVSESKTFALKNEAGHESR